MYIISEQHPLPNATPRVTSHQTKCCSMKTTSKMCIYIYIYTYAHTHIYAHTNTLTYIYTYI